MNKLPNSDTSVSNKSQRIRDELWSTFFHEMDDLLEKLESQLLDIEKNLHSEDLIASLFRTMHTLKGTAGMMGLTNVETLAHKAEDIMDLVRAHEMDLNPHIIDLMFSTLDSLKVAQSIITETRQDINSDLNIELIAALKDSTVATQAKLISEHEKPTSEIDAQIWQQIHQECCEQLDQIETAALAFEKGNHTSFDQLFRSLHSLKSTVDFAHLINATALVHRCEDLVGLLRDEPAKLSKNIIDTVLAVTDVMRKMFESHRHDNSNNKTTDSIDLSLTVIQPLLQQVDAQLLTITGSEFSQYTSRQLTDSTINSQGVLLNKNNQPDSHFEQDSSIDARYWQDYFALINENLASITQAVATSDTITIADCYEEMMFASKQLQLNAAIEALQTITATENEGLSQLNFFFENFKNQLTSKASPDTPNTISLDIEAFFDFIWKTLSNLRKLAQVTPINTQTLQAEVAHLTEHCQHVSPLDIEHNLQQWSHIWHDQPLDVIKISALINDLYTYFWDQEDQLNQGNGNLIQSAVTNPSELCIAEIPEPTALTLPGHAADMMDDNTDHEFPDPVFIIDFLEAIHQQLPEIQRLHQTDQTTANLPEQWFTSIANMAKQSQALGFNNLTQLLNRTLEEAKKTHLSAEVLSAFEIQLFAEICKIGDALPNASRKDQTDIANLTKVFKQWHSEHCFQELALFIHHLTMLQSNTDSLGIQPLDAMQSHLQSLLFSCQYWQLTQCEQAVLLLIDFLHRAEVEPTRLTPTILEKMLQLGQHLGRCFDFTLNSGEADETTVAQWIAELTQQVKTPHNIQQITIARRFCQSLHLPACLLAVLAENDYEKMGGAILQQQALFIIFSDIDDDTSLVDAFFDLLETPTLSVITSATDYLENRSVFYYLVACGHNTQPFIASLQAIDPSQQRLTLTRLNCSTSVGGTLVSGSSLNGATADINTDSMHKQTEAADLSKTFNQHDLADLDRLQQALGQLVSIKTHMQQSSEAIKNYRLSEDVLQHLQPMMPSNHSLPIALQQYLNNYAGIIDQWMQSQEALNNVADQLQDSLKNLQQAPIQPLLENLQLWFNKQVINENVQDLSVEQQASVNNTSPYHLDIAVPSPEPVMLNKTQIPALENALRHLMIACRHNQPSLNDASIQVHAQHIERGTQCSLTLSPSLTAEQQTRLNLADLQSCLAESSIRIKTQFEQDELHQIDLMLEDDHRIIEGLIVAADQMHYVIPTHMVKRLVNRQDVELMSVSANASCKLVKVEQQLLPLSFFPKQLLQPFSHDQQAGQTAQTSGAQSILLVIESANKQQALLIDELLGFQQVVVTPLQGQLQHCRSFSGCCVLGKDKVAMVFDTATALE